MKEGDSSQDADGGSNDILGIAHILKNMSADIVHLVMVEARLCGHTALAMIGLTLVIALLLVGGWLFTGAALVVSLTSLQTFSLPGAMLTVALVHLLFAALAFWRLRYIRRDLTFRESRASVNNLLNNVQSLIDTAGQGPQEK